MNQETPNQAPAGYIALADLPNDVLIRIIEERHAKAIQAGVTDPVKLYHAALEERIPEMVALCINASETLARTKLAVFTAAKQLLNMKYAAYGIKSSRSKYLDEQRQHCFSDSAKNAINIGFNITESWGPDADVGVAKIHEYLQSLLNDIPSGLEGAELIKAKAEAEKVQGLVELVFNLLRKNKHGNIKLSSIAKLEGMIDKFNSPLFTEGVKILKESFQPNKSVWFIEATGKNGINKTVAIPLSITAVPFPDDFIFEFLPPRDKD